MAGRSCAKYSTGLQNQGLVVELARTPRDTPPARELDERRLSTTLNRRSTLATGGRDQCPPLLAGPCSTWLRISPAGHIVL